ncbi:gastric triacylglycerol lipase-like [Numida meleagris]|uniref:gastric triacylglycerol lipase-like n=1 Tax=Numida meleagris TaxID=8996 RepID=UPI000B3D95E3|nr:gastric triacylglycerol lipase-like [Numida meleagris]
MRCLLMLLCSQAVAFSIGFIAPHTLKSEEGLHRKQRNPEDLMNVSEMIRYHGYPCEEYEVTTKDGYILGVFRIPSGRNMHNTGQKPAVFLQHAFLGDATHWISNLPNNSLGFLLADAGYDVWLGNSRGNTWSLKHQTLKPTQKEFWQFSFDEMGKYDIPAELYFIMNKTRQKDIYYIGHSEGTASGFIAFSTYPELAKRVKVFFALGPVTTCTYAIGPLMKITKLPAAVLRLALGWKGAMHQIGFMQGPVTEFCTNSDRFCGKVLCYIAGGNIQNLNTSRIDVYVGHSPAGTSVQNIIHWHQVFHADRFQAYDYGWKENMKKYNQPTPPAYEIEKISTPIAVWSGGQDKFADLRDMAKLLSRINNLCYHKHFPDWGHLDFIWGLDAAEKMYVKIIELLIKYL